MIKMSKKEREFNDFRFEGLEWSEQSNKYLTMKRVSKDENRIVVKVGDAHLIQTRFGYALILDRTRVIFLKDWQVSRNYYGNEILLTREYFNVKEWGEHNDFEDKDQYTNFNEWVAIAKEQDELEDEDGFKANSVKWLA